MKVEVCPSYCGISCVDGTCPLITNDNYSCEECWLYKGCEDCCFQQTTMCCKFSEEGK